MGGSREWNIDFIKVLFYSLPEEKEEMRSAFWFQVNITPEILTAILQHI
jgi:hypothetical protein